VQHSFRRSWRAVLIVIGALVAAACGPSAQPKPAAPVASAPAPAGRPAPAAAPQAAAPAAPLPASVQQEWERVVAAAAQEGKVVAAVPPGPQYEPAIRQAFTKAFPNIQVEMVNIIGGQFRQRVEKERAADQYDWDVCICGAGADTYRLIAAGVFDPIKNDLILPDVLDDSKWMGGFDGRFSDDARQYSFDFGLQSSAGAYVNRDTVRESELSSYDDLWKPQFRGKITWQDPRGPGSGVNAATVILHVYGEDKLRELWTTQQIQLSTDDRQMAEWVMRGTRPVGIGMVYNRGLALLHQEGLAQNVKTIPYPVPVAVGGPHSVLAVNRPPHPNARKVFINWLLTPDGQNTIFAAVQSNSARLDVPIYDPDSEVPKGVETINTQAEVFVGPRSRAGDLAREIFK
jgi:ABC-type Fe3+ transport system substrate-binding protein